MENSPQTTTSSLPFSTSSAYTMSVADDVKYQHRQLFNPVTPDISPPPQLGKGESSMKSTRTQDIMDSSNVTSADIREMEQVRQHLHIMLQNCKGFAEQPDYNQAPSSATDYETQDNDGDVESMASVDTTALLARLLPNSSPLSELQMHGQHGERSITSHDQSARQTGSLPTERKLRTISSSKVAGDRTLITENSLLRDHLEKEQFRRKHCEQQIQDLHGKLLEVQQQLAVAVSAERKKDAMIEQLDKTLAKVVEGWKKHESEKLEIIEQLKEERGTAEQSHQRQEEMLLQFEKELAQAVEALTREQEKARQAESEKQTQLQQQKEERSKLLELLSKEKENVSQMEVEKNKIIKESEQAQQKYMDADASLKQQMNIAEELQEKLTSLEEEHSLALVKGKEKLDHEKQTVQDVQVVLVSVQKEVQRLEIELDTANREKESLRMELHLMEAKHEANRTKEETERQAELEREMTKRLEQIQDKMSKAETEMRDSHRKQIQEMNKKHKEDLEQQLAKFHEELKRKDVKLKSVSEEYEERITDCQEKMASLANIRQHVENERQMISVRLQQMMQSHCEEAMKLLNSSATKLSPLYEKRQLRNVHSNFLNGTTETSLKLAKDDTHHLDKVPIPAAKSLYPSLQPQQQQQQQQQQLKSSSNVFPLYKPTYMYNTTQGSSSSDSGIFSGSYNHTHDAAGKHGILFHDQSSLEFHPLHAVVDNDSSIISGQHGSRVATTWNRTSASTVSDNSPKLVATGNVISDTNMNLVEQDLDALEPDTTLCSVFTHEQNEETLRQTSPEASTDISERLQQQESRQAELNHYVKMLLQRSPGDHSYEEQDHLSQGLRLIPSSSEVRDGYASSGVISPIQSDHQLEQQYMMALQHPHKSSDAVTTDQFHRDDKHKETSAQVAFTKTTVPITSISVTSLQGFDSQVFTQKPNSRLSQLAPHTPPRREKDIDDKLPPPGALTPQQVGQLSRMLGMFSEHGKPPITTEELFAYLREVQNNQVADAVTTWSQQQQNIAVTKNVGPYPSQSSLRQVGANRAKRNLDTNFQKKQDQPPQTQGPSVNGHPINATAGQVSKPTEQAAQSKAHSKQPTKPSSNGMGPPLRYPTAVQEAVKPSAKPGVQSKEKKVAPGGKQAKASAWR